MQKLGYDRNIRVRREIPLALQQEVVVMQEGEAERMWRAALRQRP
jgi:hypothetical protein